MGLVKIKYKNLIEIRSLCCNFQTILINVVTGKIRTLKVFVFSPWSYESCHHLVITIIFTNSWVW